MKKMITCFCACAFIALIGFSFAACDAVGLGDLAPGGGDSTGGGEDAIRIVSVMPNENLVDGVEQQFIVRVEYELSQEQGELGVAFNNYEKENEYYFVTHSVRVSRGSGAHTFTVNALTKNWGTEGTFGVLVALSPYPHPNGSSYMSLARDVKSLSFQ